MKIKQASSDVIFIEVDQPVNQTSDGIYIEEEWKTLPTTGVIISLGKDITEYKLGDKVFFERYSSIQTPFGETVRACRKEHILAICE